MMSILIAVIVVGWVAAAVLGTQAYFLGEQSKPIHERNWRSQSFEQVARAVTGASTDYQERVPGFEINDAFASAMLSER
ncbi:MAG: hypothetical protein WCD18_14145 [Thermosynechococcaceae cyanobacterium]